jgi:hypothetical protein
MNEEHKIDLFEIDIKELAALTPLKARDLIVECFFNAQKETLFRAKQRLGNEANDNTLRHSAANIVKTAMKDTGGDFNSPTKEILQTVVPLLAKKASAWGTPADIVERHKEQIQNMLERLNQ